MPSSKCAWHFSTMFGNVEFGRRHGVRSMPTLAPKRAYLAPPSNITSIRFPPLLDPLPDARLAPHPSADAPMRIYLATGSRRERSGLSQLKADPTSLCHSKTVDQLCPVIHVPAHAKRHHPPSHVGTKHLVAPSSHECLRDMVGTRAGRLCVLEMPEEPMKRPSSRTKARTKLD